MRRAPPGPVSTPRPAFIPPAPGRSSPLIVTLSALSGVTLDTAWQVGFENAGIAWSQTSHAERARQAAVPAELSIGWRTPVEGNRTSRLRCSWPTSDTSMSPMPWLPRWQRSASPSSRPSVSRGDVRRRALRSCTRRSTHVSRHSIRTALANLVRPERTEAILFGGHHRPWGHGGTHVSSRAWRTGSPPHVMAHG